MKPGVMNAGQAMEPGAQESTCESPEALGRHTKLREDGDFKNTPAL
jgi:hypothetical protein